MEIADHRHQLPEARPLHRRAVASVILLAVGVAITSLLFEAGRYQEAAGLIAASIAAALLVRFPISIEAVLLAWFVASPIASFYVRFPIDKSIVTFNRAVFAVLIVMLWIKPPRSSALMEPRFLEPEASLVTESGRPSLCKFEIIWILFSALAMASALC